MDRLAVFLAAIVPGLLLLAYGIAKTRGTWRDEILWTGFFLGGVGAIAAIPIEFGLMKFADLAALDPMAHAAVMAAGIAAIPEEALKFFIFLGAVENHVDVRRRQDIIVLALAVSLGFATIENLFYIALPKEWQIVAAARAVTAVPCHGVLGLMMGALVTLARVHPTGKAVRLTLALLVPVIFHALYDFPLFAVESGAAAWVMLIWLATLVISPIVAIVLCRRALPLAAESDWLSGRDIRPVTPERSALVIGIIMLITSPVIGLITLAAKDIASTTAGAFMAIIPAILAIDLIWSALRPSRTVMQRAGT